MSVEGDEVRDALECSICLELCQLPVHQCKNGHNICHSHLSRLVNCPTCREPYASGCVRNLLAEKLILKMKKELEEKKKDQQNSNQATTKQSLIPKAASGSVWECGRSAKTLYSCQAEHEEELSFEPNQLATNVRPSIEPGWLEGTIHGKRGLIPENFVQPLPNHNQTKTETTK